MNYSALPEPMVDRILVVDDVADNSFLLQAFLELEGYQVEVADNGYTALEKIASEPPDLVLLDVMMPGLNGYQVVQQIRQNRQLPFIPILLVTGHDLSALPPVDGVKVNGLIHKPVVFDELLAQVQALLRPNLQQDLN
ncbi:MAG: response regulator [Leptolyngbyaceae cyanobacterium CSU_1_3]|nr:response regulator [Leptolyngbyaceae cyanobacterium CSU_1_3]